MLTALDYRLPYTLLFTKSWNFKVKLKERQKDGVFQTYWLSDCVSTFPTSSTASTNRSFFSNFSIHLPPFRYLESVSTILPYRSTFRITWKIHPNDIIWGTVNIWNIHPLTPLLFHWIFSVMINCSISISSTDCHSTMFCIDSHHLGPHDKDAAAANRSIRLV